MFHAAGVKPDQRGLIMRKMGLVLALLSTVSMTVLPVAPSFAAAPQDSKQQQFIRHAERGDIVVLSPTQMSALEQSNPSLHAKLLAANKTGKVPHLTKAEKALVRSLTQQNMGDIKAGWAAGWIVVAIVGGVLLVWLWQPVVCKTFTWAWFCPAPILVTKG